MSVSDILKELLIDETEPSAMLINKRFISESQGIRVSTGIDYILEHL